MMMMKKTEKTNKAKTNNNKHTAKRNGKMNTKRLHHIKKNDKKGRDIFMNGSNILYINEEKTTKKTNTNINNNTIRKQSKKTN